MALAGLIAVLSMIVVLAIAGPGEGHAATNHQHGHGAVASAQTAKQPPFHDGMRELWEQHVTWTRLAFVSFAGNPPDLPFTEQRLLANQTDIGKAIKPFYGRAAGDQLTTLPKPKRTSPVRWQSSKREGRRHGELAQAKAAWYATANQISDFLSAANPPSGLTRRCAMMKTHLDQTLSEGVDQLTGHYQAGVREYDAIEHHILEMADTLSSGIVKQFPGRFR